MKTRQEQEQVRSENEGQDSNHNNADVDIQPPTTVRIDKIADTVTNHGEFNVVNNKVMYWYIVRVGYYFGNIYSLILLWIYYSYSFLTEAITIYRYFQQRYCHSYHAYHSIGNIILHPIFFFFAIQNASFTNHLNGVIGLYIC